MSETEDAVPFEDLLDAFFEALVDEKKKAQTPLIAPFDQDDLERYLRELYLRRWQVRKPGAASKIRECAALLGRLTLVMYRSERRHEPHDDPIDAVSNPAVVGRHHVDLAREVYGFYANGKVTDKMHNVVHGPIVEGLKESIDEVDQPCPLCP